MSRHNGRLPETDTEIDDPEDYSTSQRLQHIYEAKRELREMRREAAAHREQQPKRALTYYRTAVESYLMELDTLFQQNDRGRQLWNNTHFGTVTIAPPDPPKRQGDYRRIGTPSRPDPKQIEIRGLKTLFEAESPITRTFEFTTQDELVGKKTKTVTRAAYIGWTTLNAMVSETNEFVSDLGIGLDIDETDEWKI